MDTFEEVTSESWFGRLGSSCSAVVIGIVLIVVSAVVLWWNEGRAVTTARSLAEGGKAVVSVGADKVEAANEGKLVHVTGEATAKDAVKDADYGVSAPSPSLRLVRKTEMYQWSESSKTETRTKIGGGTEKKTTYTYTKEWSSTLNKSSEFKQPNGHQNPPSMPESKSFFSTSATLGAFKLNDSLLGKIDAAQSVTPEAKTVNASPQGATMRVVSNQLYKGADPNQPGVGDVRITYTYAGPTAVSVVAQQASGGFCPYQTKSGDALEMLSPGSVSADQMFKQAADDNNTLTWILRGVGWLLMTIGIAALFTPISTFASVLPFLGDIVGFGAFLFALVAGFAISTTVIAIAWIAYRPLVGVGLLAAVIGVLYFAKKAGTNRRTS